MNYTERIYLETADYGVFGTMLVTSLLIGIYYGFSKKKAKNTEDYLLGNRQLATIPVGVSIIASQINSNILLLYPTEVYLYGLEILVVVPVMLLVTFVIVFIVLPMLYNCGITNVYEYLELRFDHRVRYVATIYFFLLTIGTLPIITFSPSLALSHVSGINVHVINCVTCCVCTIYTMLGGIKAVVWTDVVQAGIMVASCFTILVIGLMNVGSFTEMIQRTEDGGRLKIFNMDIGITSRQSFWSYFFNFFIIWLGYLGFNQSVVQRLVAVPSLGHAKRVMYIFCLGYAILLSTNCFIGLVIYATYYKCDPIKEGVVPKSDKLMPHFVMNTIGNIPGLPGIFFAAIFSASLSTVSANLNSIAGIIYQDVIQKFCVNNLKESRAKIIIMSIVFVLGVSNIFAGFIVDTFIQTLPVSVGITSITIGTTTGLFILAMFCPWANGTGAIVGSICSVGLMSWIMVGAQLASQARSLIHPTLPTSVEECNTNISSMMSYGNMTEIFTTPREPFFLYKLSFNYYAVASVLVSCIVGLAVSFVTGFTNPREVNKLLLAPCVHWMLPKKIQRPACPKLPGRINEEAELFIH